MHGLPPGTVLHERYQVQECLKRALWVNHYRAEAIDTRRRVVIKEFPTLMQNPGTSHHEQLEKLSALTHPSIMAVLEHFTHQDRVYVVLEYCEGSGLHTHAPAGEARDHDTAAVILTVCEALSYCTQREKPHVLSCIAPSHLLVAGGAVKIIDLGISHIFIPLDRKSTILGGAGVPGFAAPEEYGRGKVDSRSDVYSLGMLIYYLFTRQAPPDAIDRLLGREELTRPSRLRKTISADLEILILKATSLRPEDRYDTPMELERAFNDATSRTWSAVHLPPQQAPAEKAPLHDAAAIDLPHLEPYHPVEEWLIDHFRKNETGCTSPIGIDLGSDAIKLTALVRGKEGLSATLLARVPTPIGFISEGELRKPRELGIYLKEWLESKNFPLLPPSKPGFIDRIAASAGRHRRSCTVAIGGGSLFLRSFETSHKDKAAITYQAHTEIADLLPCKIEEVRIDISYVHHEKKSSRILVFAIPRAFLEKVKTLVQALNFTLTALEFEPLVHLRTLRLIIGSESLTRTVALLNMGSDYSSLSFFGKGSIRHCRIIPLGGNTLTVKLMEALSLSHHKVERLKREYDILPDDGARHFSTPLAESLFPLIEPLLKQYVKELRKTFTYFGRMYDDNKVELLFVTGGGGLLRHLDRYLTRELELSVVPGNVFRTFQWSSILEGDTTNLDHSAPLYATSLGLAGHDCLKDG